MLKWKYALTQKLFYEFGNKSRKSLARALQVKKAAHTIHTFKDPSGNIKATSEYIADQFVHYFSQLYNLPPLPLSTIDDNWIPITVLPITTY